VGRARRRLDDVLVETFDEERRRFDALAPGPDELEALAADLRAAAAELRQLPAVVPTDAVAMFRGPTGDRAHVADGMDAALAGGADAGPSTRR
jgi:hypothetical protein